MRCLIEDLRLRPPSLDIHPGLIDHPLIEEARRLADTSPLGQKRILAITERPVFRLRTGRMRGATWVESDARLWLLAAKEREARSRDDAYLYFAGLWRGERLFPSQEDRTRLEAEAVASRLPRVTADIAALCAELRRRIAELPVVELEQNLAGFFPTRMKVSPGDPSEVWVAVSIFDVDRRPYLKGWRTAIFAEFARALSPCEFDFTSDFGREELPYWEEACLYVR